MRRLLPCILSLALGAAYAQVPGAKIYSCVSADGRRLTSDRPIPECKGTEQIVHRNDGSVRTKLPPAQSPEERAAEELRQRELAGKRAAQADAARHDRNLLTRFRNRAQHDVARAAALDDLVKATELSVKRLSDLARERKSLDEEAEFYKGKALPPKLRQQFDVNDAATEAQRHFISQQNAEKVRVNIRYDMELARLEKLWAGAPPGSLGPPPNARDVEAAVNAAMGASAPPAGSAPVSGR